MAWGCLVVVFSISNLVMRGHLPNPLVTIFWLAVAAYCYDARKKVR